jgi:hypothetical protein
MLAPFPQKVQDYLRRRFPGIKTDAPVGNSYVFELELPCGIRKFRVDDSLLVQPEDSVIEYFEKHDLERQFENGDVTMTALLHR